MIDLAAMGDIEGIGPYENEFDNPENFDFIRVLTDDDGDGEFDVLTEFLAVDDLESEFFGFLAAVNASAVVGMRISVPTTKLSGLLRRSRLASKSS